MNKVQAITLTQMHMYLSHMDMDKIPKGCFMTMDDNIFLAMDNSTGDCFMEEFDSYLECVLWLQD